MSNTLDFLSDNDIRQISSLVDTLDRATFDYLQVDVGDLKLTIGKGQAQPFVGAMQAPAALSVPPPAASFTVGNASPAKAAAPAASAALAPSVPSTAPQVEGAQPIIATTMGRFYSRPDPASAPYVSLGAVINSDTVVGLIEVMKLFNAVSSRVAGTVVQICVEDAQVVEYGQVLFYVKPDPAGVAK